MVTQNRVDKPPLIPPTGRGRPGVCADPLRPDDGGCDMSLDMRTIHVSRWTPWLSDLLLPPMLPQRLRARPPPFSSRNSTHWRSQLPRDLQMVLPPLRRACPSKSGTSSIIARYCCVDTTSVARRHVCAEGNPSDSGSECNTEVGVIVETLVGSSCCRILHLDHLPIPLSRARSGVSVPSHTEKIGVHDF